MRRTGAACTALHSWRCLHDPCLPARRRVRLCKRTLRRTSGKSRDACPQQLEEPARRTVRPRAGGRQRVRSRMRGRGGRRVESRGGLCASGKGRAVRRGEEWPTEEGPVRRPLRPPQHSALPSGSRKRHTVRVVSVSAPLRRTNEEARAAPQGHGRRGSSAALQGSRRSRSASFSCAGGSGCGAARDEAMPADAVELGCSGMHSV